MTTQSNTLTQVTLTSQAVLQVQKEIAKKGSGRGLRFFLEPSGCSRWSYLVSIVDEPLADDYIFPAENGISVFVDANAYERVKGTCIDYVKEGLSEHFVFDNPNAKDFCGCGESFNV